MDASRMRPNTIDTTLTKRLWLRYGRLAATAYAEALEGLTSKEETEDTLSRFVTSCICRWVERVAREPDPAKRRALVELLLD